MFFIIYYHYLNSQYKGWIKMQLKKNQVIQIAKELFAEQGVNESSVQDIINKGNISKGTFYNYFSSRNEFLIAYLEAARHEEMSRRNHLEQLDNLSEQEIFSKQINTWLKINREFTLFPIFEIARQSKGPLLKNYMKDSFLDELQWLIKRLVHLY